MTRQYELTKIGEFYRDESELDRAVCVDFVSAVLGEPPERISISVSTVAFDGWIEAEVDNDRDIACKGKRYLSLFEIDDELFDMGIMPGDTFWLRVKPIPAAQAVSAPTPA